MDFSKGFWKGKLRFKEFQGDLKFRKNIVLALSDLNYFVGLSL